MKFARVVTRSTLILAALLIPVASRAQSDPEYLTPILTQTIQSPVVTAYQLRQYMMQHVPPLPNPANAQQWTAEAKRIRRHLLDDAVIHGWPREWVPAAGKFAEAGVLRARGYRIRKYGDEIVLGSHS